MTHQFTFTLDDDQLKIWERYAELKECTLEHLVKVLVPQSLTDCFLTCIANPELADRVENEVLALLPVDMQEIVLRQRDRLNKKLSEPLDSSDQ